MSALEIEEIDDDRLAQAWPVMAQLRPHLSEADYLAMVGRMRVADGFRVFAAMRDGAVVGVAGVRPMELLYCGRILQIDDLVVSDAERSTGVGKALVDHVKAVAKAEGRSEVHLDSGLARTDAHRFYDREGFERLGYHFRIRT
jgi:GNAT superfamily N-acetyltransferase